MTVSAGVWDAKTRLSEFIGRVLYGKERVLITRKGRPVAALVSTTDLARLEAMEGPESVDARRRAMAEALARIAVLQEQLQAESPDMIWPDPADVLREAREEELL